MTASVIVPRLFFRRNMRKLFRIFISRYALSLVFILAEIALIAYLAFYAYTYSFLFVLFAGVVDLLVVLSLINKDTNPEFKLTWLAVVVLVPLFGGALYITFYSRKLTKKESEYLSEIVSDIKKCSEENNGQLRSLRVLSELSLDSELGAGNALAITKDDALAELYSDCKTDYYATGEKFFSALKEALAKAERYIFLEYFIVSDGVMWKSIEDILLERAAFGVEIKMLYDDIGSMSTVSGDFDKRLRREGIECYRFAKIKPRFMASYNNRDHRKICVVDGNVAFTGGVNIADEYINEIRRFGHWKDGGVRVCGEAAEGFARLFLVLFDFTVGKKSDYSSYFLNYSHHEGSSHEGDAQNIKTAVEKESLEHENIERFGYVIPFGSGPAPAYSEPVGKNVLMNIINASKRYLYITTPYLIIDYDLTEALRCASKRGVDVRIITPAVADKKIVKIMTKSSYPYLIKAGVRIFEYSPGFIHEKLVVSDDLMAVVGTINLDYRSLVHHFEDALWMFGGSIVKEIRDSFMLTESVSLEIGRDDARLGFNEKIIRTLIKIFAPLL